MIKDTSKKGKENLKASLGRSVFLCLVSLFTLITVSTAWFAKNDQTRTQISGISANGTDPNFEFATVGKYEKGVYDDELFSVFTASESVRYGDVDYYIINGDNSIRLTAENNVNNIYNGQEIRPGDKGKIELYVICKGDLRTVGLIPTLELFVEGNGSYIKNDNIVYSKYTNAHIMTFFTKNEDGTYGQRLEYDKKFEIDLDSECEKVYSDNQTEIYKMVFYWVWPEELHNLIYLNRTYNKNLFNDLDSEDYIKLNNELNDSVLRNNYFVIEDNETFPAININMNTDDYLYATSQYNQVDEIIGYHISFIKFGFELQG